jgi:hypothetical protein
MAHDFTQFSLAGDQCDVLVAGGGSAAATLLAKKGYRVTLLLGDAYAFIDPVFSSGVSLGMNSAFVGADVVDTCLRQPDKAVLALKHFNHTMKHGAKEFSWFIYRVTNPAMRNLFMTLRNYFRVRETLLLVLAGDIFGKTPIWRSLLAFKAIYFLTSLAHLRRTVMAWKRRRLNIRTLEEAEEISCR